MAISGKMFSDSNVLTDCSHATADDRRTQRAPSSRGDKNKNFVANRNPGAQR
jgi:hypothetical protein